MFVGLLIPVEDMRIYGMSIIRVVCLAAANVMCCYCC